MTCRLWVIEYRGMTSFPFSGPLKSDPNTLDSFFFFLHHIFVHSPLNLPHFTRIFAFTTTHTVYVRQRLIKISDHKWNIYFNIYLIFYFSYWMSFDDFFFLCKLIMSNGNLSKKFFEWFKSRSWEKKRIIYID